jgi:hypothetical protein
VTEIVITQAFCGPPTTGNGGYVGGLMAHRIHGPATVVLRKPIPLDVGLDLQADGATAALLDPEGVTLGDGRLAEASIFPTTPAAPSLEAARLAGERYIGLGQPFHPICFTCSPTREEGSGLRVCVGQLAGEADGEMAGAWTPHANFADTDGLTPTEVIWGALDCPGYYAWVGREGRHGALLGTMTGEILRRPKVGEACIVRAWPLDRDGRKATSGVVLFTAQGELLARAFQIWIRMNWAPAPAAALEQAAT